MTRGVLSERDPPRPGPSTGSGEVATGVLIHLRRIASVECLAPESPRRCQTNHASLPEVRSCSTRSRRRSSKSIVRAAGIVARAFLVENQHEGGGHVVGGAVEVGPEKGSVVLRGTLGWVWTVFDPSSD